MNTDLVLTLAVLLVCVILFIINRPRMDAVALLVIIVLPLLGVITTEEAIAGFSDPSVLLIALLFVIGEGLVRTGVAYQMGDWLVKRAANNETRLLIFLMASVTLLGAVMSSTGIVAIFIPVALSMARRLNISPGRLMMPLSFAGLLSGMMTLVATPPNMVLNGALIRAGYDGFNFFSFTPFGLIFLVIGIAYMMVARRWLADRSVKARATSARPTLQSLVDAYRLGESGASVVVLPGCDLVGQTLGQLKLRTNFHANVIAIRRRSRFHNELISPSANTRLEPHDLLLVDSAGNGYTDIAGLEDTFGVTVRRLKGRYFTDQSREVGMAEVLIPAESDLVNKTITESKFRTRFRLNIVGIRRNGKPIEDDYLDEPLKLGDTLLVVGPWKSIRQLQTHNRDFVLLTLPVEVDMAAPALHNAPFALLSLGIMIVLMVTGVVSNVQAALIACMLMGAFGCVTMNTAYKSINWQSLIVIVGMMPFAVALEKTGGIQLAVQGLIEAGGSNPRLLLLYLFLLTSITGTFISNTATAVLVAPIAISIAAQAGLSPMPFAMTVALAASAAFMAPISSPVNMLVIGPGQYKFMDFVKVGVPFTLVVLVITILLVPVIFPF